MRAGEAVNRAGALAKSTLLWALLTLPAAPSIYVIAAHGNRCFGAQPSGLEQSPIECLITFAALAPIAALFGGLAHDDVDPPSMWPGILTTAIIIGGIVAVLRYYRNSASKKCSP